MKTSQEIQRDVLAELKWEPSIDAASIGVGVHEGVVTLSGHVKTYGEKRTAEKAAKRVSGVQAVADDLVVRVPSTATRDDTDIAQAATRNLKWNTMVPQERIKVLVDDGWVTLEGEVDWKFERTEAEKAVIYLAGVKGVSNLITIKPRVTTSQIEEQIKKAFARHSRIDADEVFVTTAGEKVILRGKVRSWAEYEDAEWAAWSAPGVAEVENHLRVEEPARITV